MNSSQVDKCFTSLCGVIACDYNTSQNRGPARAVPMSWDVLNFVCVCARAHMHVCVTQRVVHCLCRSSLSMCQPVPSMRAYSIFTCNTDNDKSVYE